jgi:hypothetical protein
MITLALSLERWMICLAYLGCTVLSFVWIVLMWWFAGVLVWSSIVIVLLLITGLLAYTSYRCSS